MSGPLYVPVLPTRGHAVQAYQQLNPSVQKSVSPLWTLPPRHGADADSLAGFLRADARAVAKVQRHHPAWIDAPFADERQLGTIGKVIAGLAGAAPLRPVTGPGRPVRQQAVACGVARESANGLGIRVFLPAEWDGSAAQAVVELIDGIDSAVELDLLLDLTVVHPERDGAGKEALRALDALLPLTQWRTAAVLAGGFPQVKAEMVEHGLHSEPRMDWRIRQELRSSGRTYTAWLGYGDYGIQHPATLARDPSSGKGGPPWGVLRYTTDEAFVLAKVVARGAERAADIRATAGEVLALPGFRGAAASAGESWLRDCARGRGSKGTGAAGDWLRVGNVQHMTYVVECLRAGSQSPA